MIAKKDELDSFLEDDGTAENKKTVYESDFEELNEEEIFNELMDEGNLNSDELDELTSNIEKDGEIKNLIEDGNIDSKNIDEVFLEDEEISETLETIEDDLEKINEKEVEDFVENNLDDIVNEKDFDLEYEGDDEILDEVEKTKLEIEEIKDVEKIEESENTNNELVEGAAKVEKKITEVKPKLTDESFSELPTHKIPVKKLKSKRPKPILYFLIGLFLIVAAVGIYYLLFNDPYLLKDEHDVEVALSEKHAQEFEEAKASANNENTDETIANDEAVNEVAEQVKEDPKVVDEKIQEEIAKSIPVKSVETKKESIKEAAVTSGADEIKMIESSSNESEASKNIYFDGTTYSVQVASFKSKSIAEREAQKLLKKGFPAFLVKTYIKKFDGTWHRVRIGPYSTLGEAKSNQSILN
ncbi:MAG: SPOR domain-containing protein [Ignavibacteriales bacterium]|nr:SPOR domain-containing protein [Ignavibacteriales bacterium]